jgi:predicted secreted protein
MELAGTRDLLLEARRINLKVGETYQLKLEGLSGAGYTWEYFIEGPQGIINISREKLGVPPELPPGGPPPDSFEREDLFTITAMEPGIIQVRLFLHRPWERDKPPLRELCLKILVSK